MEAVTNCLNVLALETEILRMSLDKYLYQIWYPWN
jgi:hypothetical protein